VLFKAEGLRRHLDASSPEAFSELTRLLPLHSRQSFAAKFENVALRLRNECGTADSSIDTASPIIEAVIASNQMHTGGFLFREFMSLPIIKRDIVFRELYELSEVERALSDLPDDTLAHIMEDLSIRGSGPQLDAWRRLLYRHSAI
jgi:hypothetical protein